MMNVMKVIFLLFLLSPSEAFTTPWTEHNHAVRLFSTREAIDEKQIDELLRYKETGNVAPDSQTQRLKSKFENSVIPNFKLFSSPAEYENTKFKCDDSVYFWRDYNREGLYEQKDYIKEINDVSNRFVTKGGDALNYWIRHNIRTGYFVSNAVLGVLSSKFLERVSSQGVPGIANDFVSTDALSILTAEAFLAYEQDYDRIARRRFKVPYDMYTKNRQNSPSFMARQTGRFITEAVGTLARRNRGSQEDKDINISDSNSNIYPDYYKTAFHYQTNGWMSQESANVYETSTETLFFGRQDAMQRTALVPLVQFAEEFEASRNGGGPMKVLEVACGTGRFITFARDNLPLDTEFTAVDLSPFYLNNARENDENWRSIRKKTESKGSNQNVKIAPATFVQAKGEDLPFDDEEFDAVVCMYMYHEIPRNIRGEVSAEMARVIKKGGLVILTDSYQLGDRPVNDKGMGNFEKMNEPYYKDYIEDFLPQHFEKVGLECGTKLICSSTKTLAFHKPDAYNKGSSGATLRP